MEDTQKTELFEKEPILEDRASALYSYDFKLSGYGALQSGGYVFCRNVK